MSWDRHWTTSLRCLQSDTRCSSRAIVTNLAAGGIGALAYFTIFGKVEELAPENFVPRLSFVVVIELFAYFFLQLYKSNLGDILYVQNEITNIQSRRIALTSSAGLGDRDSIKKTIEELAKTERNFLLKKGQSTVDLEKQKNGNLGLDKIFDKILEKFPGLGK